MRSFRPTLIVFSWLLSAVAAFSAEDSAPRPPGFLGARLAEALHYQGLWLAEVLPDMAADRAGMRREDLLIRVAGEEVGDPQATLSRISAHGAGSTVTFTVLRAGQLMEFDVVLGENPWIGANRPDTSPGLHAVQVIRDQPYHHGADSHPRQRLDLYLPKMASDSDSPNGQRIPLLMWVHGGAWSTGDPGDHVALGRRFAERGVAVAMVSHRLSRSNWLVDERDRDSAGDWGTQTGVLHPEHVKDCARAFAWLHEQVDGYRWDPDRLFVGGMSSGAHLTALLATDPRYLAEHQLAVDAIAGVIPIEGVYDVPAYREFLNQNDMDGDEHMQAVFGPTEKEWWHASVTRYLSPNSVPMLVLTGRQRGYQVYTEKLEVAARRVGNDRLIFERYLDRDHGTFVLMMKRREPDPVRARIIHFITGD